MGRFSKKNPSETWTQPPTSMVNSDFFNVLLCKAPLHSLIYYYRVNLFFTVPGGDYSFVTRFLPSEIKFIPTMGILVFVLHIKIT